METNGEARPVHEDKAEVVRLVIPPRLKKYLVAGAIALSGAVGTQVKAIWTSPDALREVERRLDLLEHKLDDLAARMGLSGPSTQGSHR